MLSNPETRRATAAGCLDEVAARPRGLATSSTAAGPAWPIAVRDTAGSSKCSSDLIGKRRTSARRAYERVRPEQGLSTDGAPVERPPGPAGRSRHDPPLPLKRPGRTILPLRSNLFRAVAVLGNVLERRESMTLQQHTFRHGPIPGRMASICTALTIVMCIERGECSPMECSSENCIPVVIPRSSFMHETLLESRPQHIFQRGDDVIVNPQIRILRALVKRIHASRPFLRTFVQRRFDISHNQFPSK